MSTTTSTSSLNTSSALAGSGTLSAAGIGSGLDVNGIVAKLMELERQPITRIDSQTTILSAEITAYGSLKGSLSSFQTAVQALTKSSTYLATKTSVADTEQLTATSDSTAAVGSYSVKVSKLAKAQKLQSAAFANSTTTVGSGTLTFDFGTYSTSGGITSFAANTAKKTVTVTIPSGSDSLAAIADAINAAKAGVGATVINDGTSSYLSFAPTDPGVANALRVQVSDNDGYNSDNSGLSRLAFDKTTGSSTGTVDFTAPNSVAIVTGTNDKFKIAVDGGTATEITIPNGTLDATNVVATVQAAIDAGIGVGKATVSLNASNRLQIVSTATSGLKKVELTSATANTGLNALFGSPTSVSATTRLTESVAPQDAELVIDNVTVTKSTNTVTDAIRGVTLNLVKESTTATTVTVAYDNSAVSSAIDGFVKAYNSTSAILSGLLAYDPTTKKAGALQGEGTVRSIQARLRSTLQTVTSGIGLTSLSEIGVSFQRDGSLAFDSTKLDTALADPSKSVKSLFMGSDGGTTNGIANKLDSILDLFLLSDGTLAARTDGLTDEVAALEKRKTELEARMIAIESRYRKQYSNLDSLVSSMNQTSAYLTRQLASLPEVSNSSE